MKNKLVIILLAGILASGYGCRSCPSHVVYNVDNTGCNVRDRAGVIPTADSQPEADRSIIEHIRQIIVDSPLSMNAKNVKIIAINGVVTLRGPVESKQERMVLYNISRKAPGVSRVVNQLEVIQKR